MKSKLKNFSLLLFVVILFLVSMFSIFALSSCTTHKTILSASNDELTLLKDYYLDNDGNIVSDNLINYDSRIFNSGIDSNNNIVSNNGTYVIDYFTVSPSTTYSYNFSNISSTYVFFYTRDKILIDFGPATNGSFITQSNCYYLRLQMNDNIDRPMLNVGSSVLPYEPFGIWYSNKITFNWFSYAYKIDLINGSNIVYSINSLSFNDYFNISYLETGVGYDIEGQTITSQKISFNSNVNVTNGYVFSVVTFGYDYTFDFYNNDSKVFSISTNNLLNNDNYRSFFVIDSSFEFNYIIFNNDGNDFMEDSPLLNLSSSDLAYQFNQGYNQGYNKALQDVDVDSYNTKISDLQQEIDDLEYSLEQAERRAQNSLDHLTYSMIGAVMSTPFNILHDYLNWNFFGINLFSLFTSLVTLLLIIWIIKFLLGRK